MLFENQLSSRVVAYLASAATSGICRSRTPLAVRTVSWRPCYDPAAAALHDAEAELATETLSLSRRWECVDR